MATTEPKPEDVEAALNGMLAQLSNAHLLGLHCLANHQKRRAARLARLEARLKPGLGANHPDVLALQAAEARLTERARVLGVAAQRKARQPKAERDDWIVYGCVLDQERTPVAGLRVRLLGKDPALRELPVAHTDEYGDFFIVVRKDDLAALRDDKAGLQLRVETEKGRPLYSSAEVLHFKAGAADYFEIVLERSAPAAPAPAASPAATTRSAAVKTRATAAKAPARRAPRGK
jgi:hypothetical protein